MLFKVHVVKKIQVIFEASTDFKIFSAHYFRKKGEGGGGWTWGDSGGLARVM